MPPRLTLFSDDFNRADNIDLGVNWDAGYTAYNALQIVTNRVRRNTSPGLESYNGTLPNDQWAELTVPTIVGINQNIGVCVRMPAPGAASGYVFYGFGATGNYRALARLDTFAEVAGQVDNGVFVAGDVIRLEVQGTALRAYRNGFLLFQATDSTFTSGRAGLYLSNSGVVADGEIDNFSAGSFPAPWTYQRLAA